MHGNITVRAGKQSNGLIKDCIISEVGSSQRAPFDVINHQKPRLMVDYCQ